MELNPELTERFRRVTLLVTDCDGVLNDGRLYFGPTGEELKVFFVRDGQGLAYWHKAGFRSGIISGRTNPILEMRARQLGMEFIWQGRKEKVSAFHELLAAAGASAEETAYVGDDTPDAEVFPLAGLSVAVGDALDEVKSAAHYVTQCAGGRGAIREVIDLCLAARK